MDKWSFDWLGIRFSFIWRQNFTSQNIWNIIWYNDRRHFNHILFDKLFDIHYWQASFYIALYLIYYLIYWQASFFLSHFIWYIIWYIDRRHFTSHCIWYIIWYIDRRQLHHILFDMLFNIHDWQALFYITL
jgi:hypothetical protein